MLARASERATLGDASSHTRPHAPGATSKRSVTDALPRAYIETRWATLPPYAPTRPHAATDGPRANAPLDRPRKTNKLQRNACGPWPWPSGTDGNATGCVDGMAPAFGPHPPTECEPNARAIQATKTPQFSAIQSNSMQFRSAARALRQKCSPATRTQAMAVRPRTTKQNSRTARTCSPGRPPRAMQFKRPHFALV